jgi:hypothetical protein
VSVPPRTACFVCWTVAVCCSQVFGQFQNIGRSAGLQAYTNWINVDRDFPSMDDINVAVSVDDEEVCEPMNLARARAGASSSLTSMLRPDSLAYQNDSSVSAYAPQDCDAVNGAAGTAYAFMRFYSAPDAITVVILTGVILCETIGGGQNYMSVSLYEFPPGNTLFNRTFTGAADVEEFSQCITLYPGTTYSFDCVGRSQRMTQPGGEDSGAGNRVEARLVIVSAVITPNSVSTCPSGTVTLSVATPNIVPLTYQWQIQIAPGPNGWANLTSDPLPLPCGGSAHASAPASAQTDIGISPCPSLNRYQVRCIVSNDCATVTSDEATYLVCAVDFNCDGSLNSQDFFDFLGAFFAGTPNADFNADGAINSQDFFDFLTAFFAGC